MNNGLIICPDCSTHQVLGSIDVNGAFHVLRYKGKSVGMTSVISDIMTIMCHCGFGTTVNKNYDYATPANA